MDASLTAARDKLAAAEGASDDAWKQDIKPALDTALKQGQRLYEDVSGWVMGQ